ncbi:MAG: hypothetical protein QM784_21945 [Polyangiaceae bacterium]
MRRTNKICLRDARQGVFFCLGFFVLSANVLGCSNKADDCSRTLTCKPEGGSDSGGASSSGTSSSSGGSAKGGNQSSVGGTTATTTAPCDGKCSGVTPVCEVNTQKCVACTANGDCKESSKPVCSPTNVCVECNASGDCTQDATKPVCNQTFNACVGCLANADCKSAGAPVCDVNTNTCKPCSIDADCALMAGKGVCDAGTCVQCTGKKFEACGKLETVSLVCDSAAKTCTTDKKAGSSGVCQSCVSDAQCPAGQLCHQQMFDGKPVGYFCFWKQGDTGNGAPADCTLSTNRPYVKTEADAQSIDGESATLCTLAVTTCPALNGYRSTDCAPAGTPQDASCGFAPGVDAKCAAFGMTQYRCTTTCLSNDDCISGVTCNTGLTPRVCTFQ